MGLGEPHGLAGSRQTAGNRFGPTGRQPTMRATLVACQLPVASHVSRQNCCSLMLSNSLSHDLGHFEYGLLLPSHRDASMHTVCGPGRCSQTGRLVLLLCLTDSL